MSTPTDDLVLATRIARRYFLDNRSKTEIAGEFAISRFKVARLLDAARDNGIVTITITGPGVVDVELSDAVRRRFGLRHAVVVSTPSGDDGRTRELLGQAAAELLTEVAAPGDVLGLGWSRTVLAMAPHLRELRLSGVVQLTGALARPDVEVSATELVRDIARRTRAEPSVFYAPMIVSDAAAAEALARQQQLVDTFARFDRVTTAVVGIGGWNPPASTLYDALTPRERDLLHEHGVHADLSGVLLDADGVPVAAPVCRRVITIGPERLRRIPTVIGLAYGLPKVPAVRAALRGGFLHALVTNTAVAEHLLLQ